MCMDVCYTLLVVLDRRYVSSAGSVFLWYDEVTQMPTAPIPVILPSLSRPAPMASWAAPCDQLTEEENTQHWLQVPPKCGQLWQGQPLSRTSWQDRGEGKSSQWAEVTAGHLIIYCA